MKKIKENLKDIIFLIFLCISLTLLINPFEIIMTDELEMIILGFVSLIIITILVFLWKEDRIDEREETHLLIAGRVSFFSTAIALLVALIVQTFQHNIDIWIPIILSILLCSKIVTVLYLKHKK